MKFIGIDETKYSLKDIFKGQSSEPTTQQLLEEFHHKLKNVFNDKGLFWMARTHLRGITYFCNDVKAFLILDLTRRFLSCKFFTGHGDIVGLQKSTWLESKEICGSERFRIEDEKTLDKAIKFGVDAHGLTKHWSEGIKG